MGVRLSPSAFLPWLAAIFWHRQANDYLLQRYLASLRTHGSLCIFFPQNIQKTPERDLHPFPVPSRTVKAPVEYILNLKILQVLDPESVLPAHG